MARHTSEIQLFREYQDVIDKWDKEWLKERLKYPTKITVRICEPLKKGKQFIVQVNPDLDWADNDISLDVFDFKLTQQNVNKLERIIKEIGLEFKESLACFSQVAIWFLDRHFANIHKLSKLLHRAPEIYKKYNNKIFFVPNFTSVLLYPEWLNRDYESNISNRYYTGNLKFWYSHESLFLSQPDNTLSGIIYKYIFNKIYAKNLHKYKKVFQEHENRLYGHIAERDYFRIPPIIDLSTPTPSISSATAESSEWSHTEDYVSVTWHGKFYLFSSTQAAAIRLLDGVYEMGNPHLSEAYILNEIGSTSKHLSYVFHDGKDGERAWKDGLIISEKKGIFRLNR